MINIAERLPLKKKITEKFQEQSKFPNLYNFCRKNYKGIFPNPIIPNSTLTEINNQGENLPPSISLLFLYIAEFFLGFGQVLIVPV